MASPPGFTVTHQDGRARRGRLETPHGAVDTPAFMPVGTRGAVKALTVEHLREVGATIILSNTYHLYLRPGDELIARRGGLHRFIGWPGPILTDSGGFQIFSLGALRKVTEQGVHFRSHLDGTSHLLTPELAIDIQARLGSDIAMVLDECIAHPATGDAARNAVERSARWAGRCRARVRQLAEGDAAVALSNRGQMLFGIVQGATFPELRAESAARTVELGFDGYAIGGLSVGEPVDTMYSIVEHTAGLLPRDAPRYLMGSGMPDDLVEAVAQGVDLFDCVLPTRNARNCQLFTRLGRLNIKNAAFAEDDRPVDPDCSCFTCRHHSRAYLRHLFLSQEITGATLNTLHNLHFYLDTLRRIRDAIEFGSFARFQADFGRTFSRQLITS